MGFRSNFITEHMGGIKVPQWFIEKYPDHYIHGGTTFPIIQPWESKFYGIMAETEIFQDIQKILIEDGYKNTMTLILLHECGGITKASISKDSISAIKPTEWERVECTGHDYCYGCSDVETVSHSSQP